MPRNIIHLAFDQADDNTTLGLAKRFFADHRDAMLNASALLGGPNAARRCACLVQDLREASTLSRRLRVQLVDLHRLLSLDRVDDLESEESSRFSEIHPADPRVHEICLLSDRLLDLLKAIVVLDSDDLDVEAYLAATAA